MPKRHGSTSETKEVLAIAETVRAEYSRLRQQLVLERRASALNPPVVLPNTGDRSALSPYWRRVEELGARTRPIEEGISKVQQKLLKLVPRIRRVLIYRSALSPQDSSLQAFNQLSLATATGDTILVRPDDALLDLATMIDLLPN